MTKQQLFLTGILFFAIGALGKIDQPVDHKKRTYPAIQYLKNGPFVPQVKIEFFELNRKWIWDYFDMDGKLYSSEQYEVLSRKDDVVLIEMSTTFSKDEEFKPHHRIEVNLSRCYKRYRSPLNPVSWSIRLFYKNDEKWVLMSGLDNTLAFEEKFNCDPYQYLSYEKKTIFMQDGEKLLFQHSRWGKDHGSWFFHEGSLSGVLATKKMVSGFSSKPTHIIRFREMK